MKILTILLFAVFLFASCENGKSEKPLPDEDMPVDVDSDMTEYDEDATDTTDEITEESNDESADEILPDEQDNETVDETPDETVDESQDDYSDNETLDEDSDELPDDDSDVTVNTGSNGLIFVSGGAVAEGTSTKATISIGGTTPFGTLKGASYSIKLGVFR